MNLARRITTLIIVAFCLAGLGQVAHAQTATKPWVASWAESPFIFGGFGSAVAPEPFANQTVRQTLRLSVGGDAIRIRFSNELGAEPLLIGKATKKIALVNHGISGNQVLRDSAGKSALARFDQDVFATPGLTHIVLMEGINDIGTGGMVFPGATGEAPALRSAEEIIAGYQQLIARAHTAGVKIIGATLTPFEGTFPGYYTPEKEPIRQTINTWIRSSGEFDGVIDFDMAIRDDNNANVMKAEYNSGHSLHPGDAGYQRMAQYIDTALFK